MATGRFTFGSGNARKLRAVPAYAAGALAARVTRRIPRRWVFGSGTGIGDGALALYDEVRAARPDIVATWLVGSEAEAADAERLGIDWVRRSSWPGFRATLTASVVVVTHGFGDVNRYAVRGATVVQLWHGSPLKRLHLDTPAALTLPVLGDSAPVQTAMGWLYRRGTSSIAVLPVASRHVAPHLCSAFGLPAERVPVLGEPRTDILFRGTESARVAAARTHLESHIGPIGTSRVVLYAPTWRDGAADPAVPTAADWDLLARYADDADAIIVLRPHRLGVGSYTSPHPRLRLLDPRTAAEVMPVLWACDVLVTDYSSTMFDFAVTGRPVVFFAPDADDYVASHGLYRPYGEVTGGSEIALSWQEVVQQLRSLAADPSVDQRARRHSAWLQEQYHDHTDGRSAERVRRHVETLVADRHLEVTPPEGYAFVTDSVLRPEPSERLELTLGPARPRSIRLRGESAVVTGSVVDGQGVLPLTARRWGGPDLPLPSGRYAVEVDVGDGSWVALSAAPDHRPGVLRADMTRLRVAVRLPEGRMVVDVSAPLGPEAAVHDDASRTPESPEVAVFFESFYGRNASCNPLAIDREIARRWPAVRRYWSVADYSVQVPAGAIAVVAGSPSWHRARAASCALVINDWLVGPWRPGRHQFVLQTWHGTPLKRIALSRKGLRPRQVASIVKQSRRWDALLAQSPRCGADLRRAYAVTAPLWVEGYPRNDVLLTADPQPVRARLGVGGERLVLYAPTWRDDQPGLVSDLDLPRLAELLGPAYTVLVRGHARTMGAGSPGRAESAARERRARVLDVTTYPDTADLLLVADVLVTDYSSVMFDASVRRLPMVFYVPDEEHYAKSVRGFLWDLRSRAPGPVVTTTEDVARSVLRPVGDWSARYEAWRNEFNPRDDGFASARVVDRLAQHLGQTVDEGNPG